MQQIFGDFVERESSAEYLVFHFSPTSRPLQERWRNNGLLADFLAEYWATFFPVDDVSARKKQHEIKSAVNYIANELLENLMKYSCLAVDYPASLELYLYEDEFRFYASNAIDPQTVVDFQARIQTILTEDVQTLYIQQIEKNAAEDSTGSHMGLLTMVNDYEARLAWKFKTFSQESEIIVVTMMVRLML